MQRVEDILVRITESPYPLAKGCMLQAYRDLQLAQKWHDLSAFDLPTIKRLAFQGKRATMDSTVVVIPCSLTESLSFEWLSSAFECLGPVESFYLAISDNESTIVYYKISKGFLKPQL